MNDLDPWLPSQTFDLVWIVKYPKLTLLLPSVLPITINNDNNSTPVLVLDTFYMPGLVLNFIYGLFVFIDLIF